MASLKSGTTIGGYTAIHTNNIGSQSVNYANSAGTLSSGATVSTLNASFGTSFVAQGYNNNGGFAMNNASTYWGLMWNYASNDWRLGRGSTTAQNGWNLRWDASDNVYTNGTLIANYFKNGSVWINNGSDYNSYNENIRLFNAPNGVSVIGFSASGTSGTPTTSLLGFSDRLETRVGDTWEQRIYGGYVEARGSFRAPIFYDSQDTGYYLDPNGTSNLNQLTESTRARWNMSRIWYDRSSQNSNTGYWTGTNGWGTSQGTWANAWKGGFSGWDIWGSNTDHPQGAGDFHAQGIVSGIHYSTPDGGEAYGWMMVGSNGALANRYWLRGKWGATTSSWVEMITTGNIGSQSVSYASSAGSANYVIDSSSVRITSPVGAFSVNNGYPSGAIRINLPRAVYNSNTMMSMTVDVYEYSTGQSFTLRIGGYNYLDGNWYNVFASLVNDSGQSNNIPVYFGNNGSDRNVIWIGEPNWSFAYPNVFVRDFQAGHSQNSGWASDWSISFDSGSRTNVSNSRTAYKQIDAGNIGTQSVNYAASAGNSSTLGGRSVGSSTNNIPFLGGTRNLVINDPESYSGEVRLGAAWNRGGVYASGTLTMSTSSGALDFVSNDTTVGAFRWDSTNGSRFIVGQNVTTTPYTLIDSNRRPVIYARGAYPVLTLDHTITGNGSHGPTIQFVHNGSETNNRQWVIGTNGSGTRLDFGYSDSSNYGNSNFNPHNGIDDYLGVTWMRLDTSGNVSKVNSYQLRNGFTISQGVSNYGVFNSWVYLPGVHGFYSAVNNAHFYPNDASYGSWRIIGTRNGWNGINFDASNGYVALMIDPSSNTSGFHNQSYGWQFRWAGGTLYCNKNAYGGGTDATVLDSSNSVHAANMNQYVRTSDTPTFAGLNAYDGIVKLNEIRFTDRTGSTESDPYTLRWVNESSARGAGLSWLEFQLNDDWNEEIRIYGNSCSGFGCGTYSDNLYHRFRADGYAWHSGTVESPNVNGTTRVYGPEILVNGHSDNTRGYRIHNTSGTSVSAMFTNSSNQLVIAAGALDQINLNKKVYVNGVALGVNVAPSATAGRIDASNDIVAYSSSDERLKHNIAPIENALDKVKSLTGVEFDWKPEYKHAHGYEGHDTGIIAQQVEAVMPSAVRTNDTGFLAVRYEKLIGLLIEANKELAARVEELEKKLG